MHPYEKYNARSIFLIHNIVFDDIDPFVVRFYSDFYVNQTLCENLWFIFE